MIFNFLVLFQARCACPFGYTLIIKPGDVHTTAGGDVANVVINNGDHSFIVIFSRQHFPIPLKFLRNKKEKLTLQFQRKVTL